MLSEISTEPLNVSLDGFHELRLLFRRIGIIKPEIKLSVILFRKSVVQKDRLCVPDMQISVGLRRKSRTDLIVLPLRKVLINYIFNKISGNDLFLLVAVCFVYSHFS